MISSARSGINLAELIFNCILDGGLKLIRDVRQEMDGGTIRNTAMRGLPNEFI
jgi:hypothetical protein